MNVYTTESVVSHFVDHCLQEEFSDWEQIMLRSAVFYSGRYIIDVGIKYVADEKRMPEKERIWWLLKKTGKLKLINDGYINSIESSPEKVLEHPDSVFLLDISKEQADTISQDYGVICRPANNPGECALVANSYDIRLKYGDKKSWKEIIDPNRITPSNSMIIIDRNFFSNTDFDSEEDLFGLENLPQMLNVFLPKKLNPACAYDLTLIFDSADPRNNNKFGYSQDKKTNKIIHPGISREELKQRLDRVIVSLKRSYKINLHCYQLNSHAIDPFDSNKRNPYLESHDRRLITNYYMLEATFAIDAFGINGARANQKLTMNLAFSGGFSDKYHSFPVECMEATRFDTGRLIRANKKDDAYQPINRLIKWKDDDNFGSEELTAL